MASTIHSVYLEEIRTIFETDPHHRMPTLESRARWAKARNINPTDANRAFCRARDRLRKRKNIVLYNDRYDIPVGTLPIIPKNQLKLEPEGRSESVQQATLDASSPPKNTLSLHNHRLFKLNKYQIQSDPRSSPSSSQTDPLDQTSPSDRAYMDPSISRVKSLRKEKQYCSTGTQTVDIIHSKTQQLSSAPIQCHPQPFFPMMNYCQQNPFMAFNRAFPIPSNYQQPFFPAPSQFSSMQTPIAPPLPSTTTPSLFSHQLSSNNIMQYPNAPSSSNYQQTFQAATNLDPFSSYFDQGSSSFDAMNANANNWNTNENVNISAFT